jgi:hypothetical protein
VLWWGGGGGGGGAHPGSAPVMQYNFSMNKFEFIIN